MDILLIQPSESPLVTRKPDFPSSISSGIPPTFVATTGFFINCASCSVNGDMSIPLTNAYTSISVRYSLTLSGYSNDPTHLKLSYFCNTDRILFRYGPSPAQ